MTRKKARKIINDHGIKFLIEDAMLGDGSYYLATIHNFSSKYEAEQYVEALKVLSKEPIKKPKFTISE